MPNEYEKIIYFISDDTVHPKGDFKLDVKQVEDCDQPSKQSKYFQCLNGHHYLKIFFIFRTKSYYANCLRYIG